MNIYLGIDPGDKWVGWARMYVSDNRYICNMGVLCTDKLTLLDIVNPLLYPQGTYDPAIVICESFQLRPLGHNAFGRGSTLRLIGALQYAALDDKRVWSEVPPGNALKELPQLHLAKYIDKWMKHVPVAGSAQWQHAHSAWRVLGRYLLNQRHPDITRLARSGKKPPMSFHHTDDKTYYVRSSFLNAPTASWTV